MPPKRKSSALAETGDADATPTPRRSSRRLQVSEPVATPSEKQSIKKGTAKKDAVKEESPAVKKPKVAKETPAQDKKPKAKEAAAAPKNGAKKPQKANGSAPASSTPAAGDPERQYWLMKAEPETRMERGVDVRFSIDDLASRTEPEPWDGIRNYVARNNLRAMKKGDLAFFYHSNCKEPGIVGTMEVVQEHSPDLSAHDPKAPYYDASSKPADPKWSVVHVEYRSKFAAPVTLKELREMGGQGNPLQDMQMLKQTRLSVSKVSAKEWEHLVTVAEGRGPVERNSDS